MQSLEFWKTITMDASNLLERLLALLDAHSVRYCVIGGQAINAYVDPLVSLDLDLAVAAADLAALEPLLADEFTVQRFRHSLNISVPGSDLRVQFQTDPRYSPMVERAEIRSVLGLQLPVAAPADVLAGKVWAVQDVTRRPSKRQKDLADIARLLDEFPDLRRTVPDEVLVRLV